MKLKHLLTNCGTSSFYKYAGVSNETIHRSKNIRLLCAQMSVWTWEWYMLTWRIKLLLQGHNDSLLSLSLAASVFSGMDADVHFRDAGYTVTLLGLRLIGHQNAALLQFEVQILFRNRFSHPLNRPPRPF